MKWRVFSGMLILVLLFGLLALAFNTHFVKAIGTIYTRPDGNIDPSLQPLSVNRFEFRIVDMMADVSGAFPNFDNGFEASIYAQTLSDLQTASSRGEITHVQHRLWWTVDEPTGDGRNPTVQAGWNNARIGSPDTYQTQIINNWQRWYFGIGAPLQHGPCAAERIHNAGFQMEFSLSVCWIRQGTIGGTLADWVDVWRWNAREANYPGFDGELFLSNYMNNVLRPTAQFLARSDVPFGDGDIFCLNFENSYPTADFTWSHNTRWISMIQEVRTIFQDAGKNVVLTLDHSSWFDGQGLNGFLQAAYLGELDFISISFWNEILTSSQIPDVWSMSDVDWVVDAWSNCVPHGRSFINDFTQVYNTFGKRLLLNTGWNNGHNTLATHSQGGAPQDEMAQAVAWAAQIRALSTHEFCAGQDFERYNRNKASTTTIDPSWRNANPAQSVMMNEIWAIVQDIPVRVASWYWIDDTKIESVAMADVEGDGQVEIVTGGYYYDDTRYNAQLAVWNGATLALERVKTWQWASNTFFDSLACSDVDGDGDTEIVTGGRYADGRGFVAQLCVWDGATLSLEGVRTWRWEYSTCINSVVVSDVDGDGEAEIVTGGHFIDGTPWVAQLCVWDGATLNLEGVTCWLWGAFYNDIESLALEDVDDDGSVEIVTVGFYYDGERDCAQLAVWDGSTLALEGVKAWYWVGSTLVNSVAVGDVDADGQVEIVTGGSYTVDYPNQWAQLCVWDGATLNLKGVTRWLWIRYNNIRSLALDDVDGDGSVEIVAGGMHCDDTRDNAQLTIWDGSTLALEKCKTWFWVNNTYINSVCIGDVEADNQIEIVTGGYFSDNTRYNAQLTIWETD